MGNSNATCESFIDCAALSDVGMKRSNNQDSFAVDLAGDMDSWLERGHLLMVADGMGAHAAGELASKLAVDHVPHLYKKYRDCSAPEGLQKAIIEANAEVNRRGAANPEFHNMGTTCSVLVLLPQGAMVAHIGDSRVYRLRGSQLDQLTFDHSLVWEMRESGQLSENAELARMVPKNVITRSLGPNPTVQVDVEGPYPLEYGDTFLLCSDGLSNQVSDEEIGSFLATLPPKEAAKVLVDLANLRGGPDNITVLIAKVVSHQATSRVAGAEPLTVGKKSTHTVHLGLLIFMGVCFLAAVAMMMSGQEIIALLAALLGVIALGIVLLQKFGEFGGKEKALGSGYRLGKGPYVQIKVESGNTFVEQLGKNVVEMRNLAMEKSVPADWPRFDSHCDRAIEAKAAGKPGQAVRHYGAALAYLMQELHAFRNRKTSDSTVDLQ